MLVPGFEPGSTDRESVMMDHYTIPAVCVRRVHVYMSSAIILKVKIEKSTHSVSITFSLSVYSLFR